MDDIFRAGIMTWLSKMAAAAKVAPTTTIGDIELGAINGYGDGYGNVSVHLSYASKNVVDKVAEICNLPLWVSKRDGDSEKHAIIYEGVIFYQLYDIEEE